MSGVVNKGKSGVMMVLFVPLDGLESNVKFSQIDLTLDYQYFMNELSIMTL